MVGPAGRGSTMMLYSIGCWVCGLNLNIPWLRYAYSGGRVGLINAQSALNDPCGRSARGIKAAWALAPCKTPAWRMGISAIGGSSAHREEVCVARAGRHSCGRCGGYSRLMGEDEAATLAPP